MIWPMSRAGIENAAAAAIVVKSLLTPQAREQSIYQNGYAGTEIID